MEVQLTVLGQQAQVLLLVLMQLLLAAAAVPLRASERMDHLLPQEQDCLE
jgi:hypothetical protein